MEATVEVVQKPPRPVRVLISHAKGKAAKESRLAERRAEHEQQRALRMEIWKRIEKKRGIHILNGLMQKNRVMQLERDRQLRELSRQLKVTLETLMIIINVYIATAWMNETAFVRPMGPLREWAGPKEHAESH